MEGVAIPEDMWSPYKNLYRVIEQTLSNPTMVSVTELELCLKKYKQSFANLLRNPPKNERNRSQLRSGITDGIPISGHGRTLMISKDLVDESIIISDMYDLDEYLALELLCTAHRQMAQHPGLPRGLVAILLYYDGRKALAYALRDLFQVTSGVSWVTDASKEVTYLLSSFTKNLVEEHNILEKIINLLDDLDIARETELLTKNRAFGPRKHQNQVLELFEEIRLALATAFFNWSAQRGLPKAVIVKLTQSLSQNKSTDASGAVDDVTLTMLLALTYGYDTSVLQRQEDNSVFVQNLPLMSEPDFAQQVYDSLNSDSNGDCQNNLLSFAKFAFGLSLASMRHAPSNLQISLSKVIDQDEQMIDDAISKKFFELLHYYILEKDIIYRTEFFYRRIHMLFTDFIDFMHSKVTELRGRADETARTIASFAKEGLEPPSNLDHSFELLMLCIGKFYKGDRAGLSLCTEYWGPLDLTAKQTTRSVALFKFIRLAGELLPTTLFVPYLKMIAGLTSCERSARSAFNLLKQTTGLAGSATLSWEHFFSSLARYYTNLRQEQHPGTDTIYRHRYFNRSINPQEIEGLHAVLGVIQAVASYDDMARIAICEHPNWAPLTVLLGLLSCCVPLTLKAALLEVLAALGKSKETALPLWNNLESSQIIATIPTTNSYNICNIEMEIEQNECRCETYPLSQGTLDLLHSLITTFVPKSLGGGPRKPGLDPYLTFIINGVFLKFYNRTYKNPAEKWEVGEKCLKLLHFMLESYDVNPGDFEQNNEQNPHPGFHIMLQLHTKSEMLRTILLIIDETRTKLDDYNKFYGKKNLEACALHCLQILELGLSKQDLFFDAHSVANYATLLSGLNKILLDVNPRSRRPDHILNTTKFITYTSWLPHHALVAVKILHKVSQVPNVTTQILGMFSQNVRTQMEIRHGFVECLENDLTIAATNEETNGGTTDSPEKIELRIKEAIIDLLQDCLPQPSPNLTHYLLGFDTAREVLLSQKQKLGAIDTASNCTKSLIYMLDNHLEAMKTSDTYDADIERIIERSYNLLFSLCANQRTSETILRFLRACNDFLSRHLTALPFKNADRSYVLNQMSHLLKCAAIELKITATNCQLSRFQNLCQLLVGTTAKGGHENITMELNNFYTHSSHLYTEAAMTKNPSEKSSNLPLCHLLNCVDFETQSLAAPAFEFFDNSLMNQVLSECEYKTAQGHTLYNLNKLHSILHEELRTVQSTIASGQRKLILQEIESFLLYALKVNDLRNKILSIVKFMEAWCQTTEILFSCAPDATLTNTDKQVLMIEIIQKVLSKVVQSRPNHELSILASGTIFLLLVNLRVQYARNPISELDSNKGLSSSFELELEHLNVNSLAQSNSLSLKYILKNIIEWIILSGVTTQKLRINLYASLLNVLRIVKDADQEGTVEKSDMYVSRLDKSYDTKGKARGDAESSLTRISLEVFQSFGEKLIDALCNDCIIGHDVCRMSALACIDVIIDLDLVPGFITFVGNRGYLSHVIESLFQSDDNLCNVLNRVPENMKALYMYESKMAMLIRLASSFMGAEMLLIHKALGALSGMKVFDMHPDYRARGTNQGVDCHGFIPPIDTRFRQILFPALTLCDCIISTLGPENHSAVSQVMHFVLSHCDMIEVILRTATPFLDLGLLEELSAVTGLIASATNQAIFDTGEWASNEEITVKLHRIQRLMLNSFARFVISETTFKEIFKPGNTLYEPTETNKNLHLKYFLEIAANLSFFCRNAIANHAADHQTHVVLFSPSLKEANAGRGNLQATQDLDVLINQLKGSVEYFNSQKSITESLLRQRSSVSNLSLDSTAKTTYCELSMRYNEKQNELSLCAFITEQCLYLLWCHLDFYMRRALPVPAYNKTFKENLDASDTGSLVSSDELSLLKKNLISILNETFCKQLVVTSETKSEVDRGFNEALLRRIKNLIQFAPIK